MPGPLTGVRVIELPAIGPVPFLGMLLADLGAEVIRIDRLALSAGLGDTMVESAMGRGRRSLGLDLRKPGGADVLLRLAETADALIEGFRPGVAERLGIGPSDVLARNPRLVYGRMTGWGQDGPLASTAGHDINYLALTGLLHGIGPAAGPPVPPINYVADFGGGAMFLATGLLAALLHARATGEGQVVDAAMIEGASYLGTMTRTFQARGGWKDEREANMLDGGAPNYRCYECADGGYLAVGALEPQFWTALVTAIGGDPAEAPNPYLPGEWDECRTWLAGSWAWLRRGVWVLSDPDNGLRWIQCGRPSIMRQVQPASMWWSWSCPHSRVPLSMLVGPPRAWSTMWWASSNSLSRHIRGTNIRRLGRSSPGVGLR
jgi:alpha-methylacyl-CoA racemase